MLQSDDASSPGACQHGARRVACRLVRPAEGDRRPQIAGGKYPSVVPSTRAVRSTREAREATCCCWDRPCSPLRRRPVAALENALMGTWKVKIKRWQGVAAWTWAAGDDVCGICHMPFDQAPLDIKFPGDDCPVVWGKCNHPFHLPCINKWLTSQGAEQAQCPLCRQPWEFT